MIRYVTDPASVILPRWVQSGALSWLHHPVESDASGPGLAHLNYDGALEVAAAAGARLPTRDELLELHVAAAEAGTELDPLTLPDAFLRAQGCQPGGAWMVTREACERHDAAVLLHVARLVDSETPVANVGKHWRDGAPPGLAGLCGWWVADVERYGASRVGPGFIQEGFGWPHDRAHADYGTTTMLVRESAP